MGDRAVDAIMKAYATDAVASAARRGVVLDYSEQSLDLLDELLGRESFLGVTPRAPANEEDEATLWVASKSFGAYVGEVVLRTLGGEWIDDAATGSGTRPAVKVGTIRGYPLEKVWKRLTESEFATVGGYCRVIRFLLERDSAQGG